MRVITLQRPNLALVVPVTLAVIVVLVVSVALMTASDSSAPNLGAEAPSPAPALAPAGGVGGPTSRRAGTALLSGVNPWAVNDPATIVRFLDERCPDALPTTPGRVDELIASLEACIQRQQPADVQEGATAQARR